MDNDEIARTVYDLDCEEILRALAFLDDDAAILKWARSVKQTMVVAAHTHAKSNIARASNDAVMLDVVRAVLGLDPDEVL